MRTEPAQPTAAQARLNATMGVSGASRRWDAIVIGAGCAGSVIARELSLAGRSVLLVDKAVFPRAKVCGCCLNAAALALLSRIGLGDLASSLGAAPLLSVSLAAGRAAATLAIPTGAALSRESLDAALVRKAIEAGAEFLPGTIASVPEPRTSEPNVPGRPEKQKQNLAIEQSLAHPGEGQRPSAQTVPTHVENEKHTIYVNLRASQSAGAMTATALASCVIVADGVAGTSLAHDPRFAVTGSRRSRIGAATILPGGPEYYRPGVIYMTSGAGGYVGVVRLEDGRLNIAAAIDPHASHASGSMSAVAAAILARADRPAIPGLAESHWHGTQALTRRRPTLQVGGVLVIGDAAGYVEPFTGEGMAWAFASALTASKVALGVIRTGAASEKALWPPIYERVIAPRQRACRIVAWALRRPSLTAGAVRVLAHWPGAAGPVLQLMASPLELDEWIPRPARANVPAIRPAQTPSPPASRDVPESVAPASSVVDSALKPTGAPR